MRSARPSARSLTPFLTRSVCCQCKFVSVLLVVIPNASASVISPFMLARCERRGQKQGGGRLAGSNRSVRSKGEMALKSCGVSAGRRRITLICAVSFLRNLALHQSHWQHDAPIKLTCCKSLLGGEESSSSSQWMW